MSLLDEPEDAERPDHAEPQKLTRVCRYCSTQSETSGEYCPNCGKPFVRRSRLGKRGKIALAAALAVLVFGGGGAAIAMKIKHDNDVQAERERTEQAARERAEAERRAEERAEAQRRAEEKAERELERIELDSRRELEKSLRKSIKKDAEEKVSVGLLDGPILSVHCDPVGGGRDDLEARTGKYECLAVTEIDSSDGSMRGWEYSGTINYDKFSWAWELGD
jgi:hypothetical protein